jgi:hypothetical protein
MSRPDLTDRIKRATTLGRTITPLQLPTPPGAFAERWSVGERHVFLWAHGGWKCDCEWGQRHGGEPFNPCAHVILAATHSDLGPERFTVAPVTALRAVPDDPFEGLTG